MLVIGAIVMICVMTAHPADIARQRERLRRYEPICNMLTAAILILFLL